MNTIPTNAERQILKQTGNKGKRIDRESIRDFDACFLCLQPARDPCCCQRGHLACRECLLSYILAQKQKILAHQKQTELDIIEEDRRHDIKRRKLEKEQVDLFVKQQTSLVAMPSKKSSNATEDSSDINEQIEKRKPLKDQDIPAHVYCPVKATDGADKQHILSIKKLVSVKFAHQKGDKSCPSCQKTFNNAVDITVFKECGHVICSPCSAKLIKNNNDGKKSSHAQCISCDTMTKTKDLIVLKSDGTGFSGRGGQLEVKKLETSFSV